MLLIVGLVLAAAALLAPGLVVGPSLDAVVFHYIGRAILDGSAPYADVWDHKPPGMYVASAAAQAILGWLGPWTADWLLSVAATAGIGMAIAAILGRLGAGGMARALGAVGAVLLASHYLLALGGGLTEPVATALVATSLAQVLRRPGLAGQAVAGALLGASLLVSPQVVPGAALVMGWAVALQPARSRVASAVLLVVTGGLPIVATAAWLWAIGSLPAAVDAVITYSAAYRASSAGYGASLATSVAAGTVLLSVFLVAPAAIGCTTLATQSQPRRGVVTVALLWLGASAVLFAFEGHFYAHYAIPLVVPVGVLAGLGFDRVLESVGHARLFAHRLLIVLPLVVALVVSVIAGVPLAVTQIAAVANQSSRARAVAEALDALPPGSLFVWGNEPSLYDLTKRAPATAYIYLYPLTTPGYSTPTMIDDVMRDLAANMPEVIVDAGSDAPGDPGFLPLLIPRQILTDGRDLDLLDPIRRFVAEHYRLSATVAGWPVYVLRDTRTP